MIKRILILVFFLLFIGCSRESGIPHVTHSEAETNAFLKDNRRIWPPNKEEGEIRLKAKFKEQIELKKIKDGDWYRFVYKIVYDEITVLKGKWDYDELSFLCHHSWPTEESGIMLKALPWPFRENEYLIFDINRTDGNYLIIGYQKEEN